MKVDIAKWELHNLVKAPGGLRTRRGLVSVHTPTSGAAFVGSFTVESPFTTEPWHYLFERDTTTGALTLRVVTEELVEMFSFPLGVTQGEPVTSHAVQANQLMINAPSFSAPLYGLVGGGLITALKQPGDLPDYTALDIPAGHICVFGDRMPIAQGNVLFFNNAGTDPRTYLSVNAVALGGSIFDLFEGPDGALYVFTSNGLEIVPRDVLGSSSIIEAFSSRVPGIVTSRPRNAIPTIDAVAVLQRDHLVLLSSGGKEKRLDLAPYKGKRYHSKPIEQDDLRLNGELFPTSQGFLVGFRGARGHFLDVNLREGFQSYVWSTQSALNLVGTLKSRDGGDLYVLGDRIVMPAGNADFDGATIRGVACGRLDIPEDESPVLRRITTSAANIGQTQGVYVAGEAVTAAAPALARDVVIGAATWSATDKHSGREARTVRHSLRVRASDPQIEVRFDGGDLRVEPSIDVEVAGQGTKRRDRR